MYEQNIPDAKPKSFLHKAWVQDAALITICITWITIFALAMVAFDIFSIDFDGRAGGVLEFYDVQNHPFGEWSLDYISNVGFHILEAAIKALGVAVISWQGISAVALAGAAYLSRVIAKRFSPVSE